MWDIKQKATTKQNKQTNKNHTHRYRQQTRVYQRGRAAGENEEGTGGQTLGDRRRLDFGW